MTTEQTSDQADIRTGEPHPDTQLNDPGGHGYTDNGEDPAWIEKRWTDTGYKDSGYTGPTAMSDTQSDQGPTGPSGPDAP